MDTQIVKRVSMAEAGKVADAIAATKVFEHELSTLSDNTRRARRADLATWVEYLNAATVDTTGQDFYSNPACWHGVTAGLVSGFVQWMLRSGYAINAINRKLSTVKVFCRLASRAGIIPGDELARIQTISQFQHSQGLEIDRKRPTTRVGNKKAQSVELSPEQVKILRNLPGDTPQAKRDRLILALMLDQALRVSEAVILNVADFNLRRRTLTFYRPKTETTETHRLTDYTYDCLCDYLECEGAPQLGYLILSSNKAGKLVGSSMTERSVTRRVNDIGKELIGVENLSAHDLRHSAATRAARGGTSVNALMGLGGWTSAATAMRYVDRQKIANDGVRFDD